MPNRADNHPPSLHAVQHDVRSASDHQLPDPRLSPDPPQVRMISQSFDHGNNPNGQPFRCLRFVASHISANFLQPGSCQRGPDNLYRHSASSSSSLPCNLPQTHFGTGSSWSVPHDSSHAFMSSFLM